MILDEVHYLQNAYRGPVWEEVIIHAPHGVDLVCLSATVSNAEELADWIRTVRGETDGGHRGAPAGRPARPVPARRQELRAPAPAADAASTAGPTPRPSPSTPRRCGTRACEAGRGAGCSHPGGSRCSSCWRSTTCCRPSTSSSAGPRATTPSPSASGKASASPPSEERRQIRAIAEDHVEALSDEDLPVLDYAGWLTGLEAGYAAHHAGMVPPFKEAVEACFAAGLVKAVFATETLSLGINMPARSVVIEKLTKFTGERHEFLTPGEYTQLTGRAGRRGIDDVGYAVVLWSPFVPFDQVAGLAGARSYALTSSFRPTYNMAANLVRRYPPGPGPPPAQPVLRPVPGRQRRGPPRGPAGAQRGGPRRGPGCGRMRSWGRRRVPPAPASQRGVGPAAAVDDRRGHCGPGAGAARATSWWCRVAKSGGRVAVLSTSRRRGGDIRVRAVTPDRRLVSLGPRDFPAPPEAVAQIGLPVPYAPHNAGFQRQVASALISARLCLRAKLRSLAARSPAVARARWPWPRPPQRPATRWRDARTLAPICGPSSAPSAWLATSSASNAGSRVAPSRWPASSTGSCGSWRRGATWTDGR